ncbi:MAG: galactose mutarotase [Lentisphaerae bacterium]|nr:galactose mutarotase [Lentisphaerota bacterium]
MQITDFFTTSNGQQAKLYTIRNANGFTVSITDMGGTIVSILTPDRDGKLVDVNLGYQTPETYEENPCFFGALIGRFANRIRHGAFSLGGKTYQLECNDRNRPNSLHGVNCYGRRMWNANVIDDTTLQLKLTSPDGDAGFPGKLEIEVVYHIGEDNSISIDYKASTDALTVVNLTNHAYFNLDGEGTPDCSSHEVKSTAYARTEVDDILAPTGNCPEVKDTPYDLTAGRTFESIYNDPALPIAFDDNFIIADEAGVFQKDVFNVVSKKTGISLAVDTDQPGVQFYMGYWLDGTVTGKSGKKYGCLGAFCLETQLWPDSVNHPDFPSAELAPGELYTQKTVYRFGVEK